MFSLLSLRNNNHGDGAVVHMCNAHAHCKMSHASLNCEEYFEISGSH